MLFFNEAQSLFFTFFPHRTYQLASERVSALQSIFRILAKCESCVEHSPAHKVKLHKVSILDSSIRGLNDF